MNELEERIKMLEDGATVMLRMIEVLQQRVSLLQQDKEDLIERVEFD